MKASDATYVTGWFGSSTVGPRCSGSSQMIISTAAPLLFTKARINRTSHLPLSIRILRRWWLNSKSVCGSCDVLSTETPLEASCHGPFCRQRSWCRAPLAWPDIVYAFLHLHVCTKLFFRFPSSDFPLHRQAMRQQAVHIWVIHVSCVVRVLCTLYSVRASIHNFE